MRQGPEAYGRCLGLYRNDLRRGISRPKPPRLTATSEANREMSKTPSRGKTISEKILSAKSGRDASAGNVVVCRVDHIVGTDGSTPMAIDYFERMGGERVADPGRIVFALDHYAPTPNPQTAALHTRIRDFARRHGIAVYEVGEGISHQLVVESGRAVPGSLCVGADSHTAQGPGNHDRHRRPGPLHPRLDQLRARPCPANPTPGAGHSTARCREGIRCRR